MPNRTAYGTCAHITYVIAVDESTDGLVVMVTISVSSNPVAYRRVKGIIEMLSLKRVDWAERKRRRRQHTSVQFFVNNELSSVGAITTSCQARTKQNTTLYRTLFTVRLTGKFSISIILKCYSRIFSTPVNLYTNNCY